VVPDHLQVPGPTCGSAQEEPWEKKTPSIQLQPKETQLKCELQETPPFSESGEEQDSVWRDRRKRGNREHSIQYLIKGTQ
jgi:hypothetical protein